MPGRRLLVATADAPAFVLPVVAHNILLHGYQLYAVENWIVQRTRPITLLVVYTNDPSDKVCLAALAPPPSLAPSLADQAWDDALDHFRKDGARARETEHGIVMVTSLANFRSDYTLVLIPGGDLLRYRDQLFANINLLRMGCSGRSALSLQDPSDTTRDRFLAMYHLPEAVCRPLGTFRTAVLELVRIVQASLSLFDLFPLDLTHHDGLLCDVTADAIQHWVAQIGEPYVMTQPSDKVADPAIVSALVSLVLVVRNKLAVIGFQPPKDPLLIPRRFARALAAFVNQRVIVYNSPSASSTSVPTLCNHAFLNTVLLRHIDQTFDKYRSSDAYKLHRVVLNKLGDVTAATTSAMAPSSKVMSHRKSFSLSASTKDRDLDTLFDPTSDLAALVARFAYVRDRESFSSVRCFWEGQLDVLASKRKAAAITSDAEEERGRERSHDRSDSDDEADLATSFPWPGRVTKKFENWTGKEFGRRGTKRSSVDLSKDKNYPHPAHAKVKPIPSVIVSKDPDEPLSGFSSGQASPASRAQSISAVGGYTYTSAHNSSVAFDPDAISQRLSQFHNKWSNGMMPRLLHSASWSDSFSGAALAQESLSAPDFFMRFKDSSDPASGAAPNYQHTISAAEHDPSAPQLASKAEHAPRSVPFLHQRKRSYSFDDREFLHALDILSPERMQVDVELCAQCLIMRRRAFRVKAVIALLQALVPATSATNEALRSYQEEHAKVLQELTLRSQIAADIEKSLSATESISAETSALAYETGILDVANLWRMAQAPRHRVFAIRDRVFGTRRARLASSATWTNGGGHGRFNRVQRMLDGRRRYVDFLGRTESDVEEESNLPVVEHLRGDVSHPGEEDEYHDVMFASYMSAGAPEEGRLRAVSNWLLTLFTKWGSVLGVGRGAGKSKADEGIEAETDQEVVLHDASADELEPEDYESNSEGDSGEEEEYPGEIEDGTEREAGQFGSESEPPETHSQNRLSTVGEETEPEESDVSSEP